MIDYIELGSAPIEEECAQYKTDNYVTQAKRECHLFMQQLQRQFGEGTETNYFKIKYSPYDEDGGYYEYYNIYKDPITDSGTKKSLKGLLMVDYNDYDHEGKYVVKTECTPEEENQGLLQVIYEDGKFYNQTTLQEVRDRLKTF